MHVIPKANYLGNSSLRLVIEGNEKIETTYITKNQYHSKIRYKASSTPPPNLTWLILEMFFVS
jgi:hypothetical protein